MAKSGAAKSKRGPGRPKGSRNKVTNEAKQAILMAFDAIGGWKRLAEWIEEDPENEKIFWTKIFPRLLPRQSPEPEPELEPAPVFSGAFTWTTPDWAKKAQKEQFRKGMAQVGGSRPQGSADTKPDEQGRGGAPPGDGEV